MPNLRHHSGRKRIPKSTKCLRIAAPLDEADVVAEVVADAEQRVLRVEEIVVPHHRALAGHLAAVTPGVERLREKPVEAERLHEPEVRVDAGHLVAVAGAPPDWRERKIAPTSGVAQDVAPPAQHGVVVAVASVFGLRLDRHRADAGAADAAGQAAAGGNRNLLAASVKPIRREKNSSISSSGGANRALPSRDSRGMSPK